MFSHNVPVDPYGQQISGNSCVRFETLTQEISWLKLKVIASEKEIKDLLKGCTSDLGFRKL